VELKRKIKITVLMIKATKVIKKKMKIAMRMMIILLETPMMPQERKIRPNSTGMKAQEETKTALRMEE
jgi:hypothetical protein